MKSAQSKLAFKRYLQKQVILHRNIFLFKPLNNNKSMIIPLLSNYKKKFGIDNFYKKSLTLLNKNFEREPTLWLTPKQYNYKNLSKLLYIENKNSYVGKRTFDPSGGIPKDNQFYYFLCGNNCL